MVPLKDLEYELRMLLGAAIIYSLLEKINAGNPVNYVRDSVYLHARNLYNFFSADTRNDAKVTQFTQHSFDLSFYDTWKDALHTHASHIKTSRHTPNNVINGEHLNEQIQKFASDIESLWQDWMDHTINTQLKVQLNDALVRARREAQNDYDSLARKLK